MAILKTGNHTFHIPEEGSPCDLWKTYYAQLKSAVGRKHARTLWLITWNTNGSAFCTTRADFNRWLRKNEIDVSNASTRAIADLSAMGGNILGMGKHLTKALSIGVPVLLGGITLTLLILLFKTSRKADATDLVALTPMGRASKLSGGLNPLKK